MGSFPSSLKFEWEPVTGSNTWVDMTPDVDLGAGYQVRYGRGATAFGQPQPATLTFQLNNATGKYTPGTQLLADGVTAHPYYPNVIPRRRIRVTFIYSATTCYRYWGYIRGFPTPMENGIRPYVTINCSCRLYLLQGANDLRGWFEEELRIQPGVLLAYYPMSDSAPLSGLGSASFTDISGNNAAPLVQPYIGQVGYQAITAEASDPMVQSEGATGASFQVQSGSTTTLGGLAATLPVSLNGTSLGFWVTFPASVAGATSQLEVRFSSRAAGIQYCSVRVQDTGSGMTVAYGEAGTSGAISYVGSTALRTGVPHYIQFTIEPGTTPGPFEMKLSLDGTGTVSTTAILDSFFPLTQVEFAFSQTATPAVSGPIVLGPVLVSSGTYTAATTPAASSMYNAGTGWAGQLSGARVTKLLTYAGYTDMLQIDTGAETLSGQQTIKGRNPLSCIQDVVDTEGGGSIFYTRTSGYLRFHDRNHRANGLLTTPDLVVDAVKDLDGSNYLPAFDDENLVNSSTVTRPGGATQTYTNTASWVLLQSNAGDQVTSYASTDAAALALAQYRVSSQAVPQFRIDQLSIDALDSETATIYNQIQGCLIGDLIEVDTLTPGLAAPASSVRLFVEGWAEDVQISQNNSRYNITYDTSFPPQPMFFTDDANFGRVAEDPGSWTLTSTITSSATSISLTTGSGHPKLTNTAGDLPLYIQIGTEVMQVTAVGGASSPQTLTVVRGQQNTRAAAQTSGSTITLFPAAVLAL